MKNTKLFRSILFLIIFILIGVGLAYYVFAPKQNANVTDSWKANNPASTQSVDHSLWQLVLDDYLIDDDPGGVNLFDYQGYLDDESEGLESYLQYLQSINPTELNSAEQFAYWVNLYNALTVDVVLKDYPVNSIKEIGNSPLPTGPWNDPAITIAGQELTLNHIEHSILRPIWNDYRIHFAVNCASIGCPDLQAEAFTASNTQALLEVSASDYLNHPRGLQLSDSTLTLSSIFDWYAGDFGESEAQVIETLTKHLSAENKAKLATFDGSIKYDYDWGLNGLNE